MEDFTFVEDNFSIEAVFNSKDNLFDVTYSVAKEMSDKIVKNFWEKRSKTINMPGFRKGKAPRHLIEKKFGGKLKFYSEPFSQYANIKTVEKFPHKVILTDDHEVHVEDDYWTVTFKLWCEPEVKLNEQLLQDIDISLPKMEKGNYVDKKIESFAKLNPYLHIKYGDDNDILPAEEGDMVEVSIEAKADGKIYPDGCEDATNIRLVRDAISPKSLYDNLIGSTPGHTFTLKIPNVELDNILPAFQQDLKGKSFEMKVVVNQVYTCDDPEVDDDLAISAGYDNLDHWKRVLNDSADKIINGQDERAKRMLTVQYLVNISEMTDFPDIWAYNKATEFVNSNKKGIKLDENLVNNIKVASKHNTILKAVGEYFNVPWDEEEDTKNIYSRDESQYAEKVLQYLINEKVNFTYVNDGNDKDGEGDRGDGRKERSSTSNRKGTNRELQA